MKLPAAVAGSGLCAAALYLAAPWELNIPAFLAVLATWTAVSISTWASLRATSYAGGRETRLMGLVLLVAAGLRLPFVALAPTPSTDAYRYSWEGRVANAGFDPYRLPPSSPKLAFLRTPDDARINHRDLAAIYPPIALTAFRLAAMVSADVRAQKAFFALCDLAVCLLLMRLLRRRGMTAAWAAVYAWHPLPVVEFAGAGHLDSLMLLGVVAGLDLWESGRRDFAALAWAAAALTKVAPVVALPWLLLRRPRAAILFLAAFLAGGLPALPGLVAALHGAPGSGIGTYAATWMTNPSAYALVSVLTESQLFARFLMAVLLALISVWRAWAVEDAARYFSGAMLAVLLVSPVVQPWYVLWLLPLALITGSPAALAGREPRRAGDHWGYGNASLAWSWVAGSLYLGADPRLRAFSLDLPLWSWLWLAQYAVVYGLLAWTFLSRWRAPLPAAPDPPRGGVLLRREAAWGLR